MSEVKELALAVALFLVAIAGVLLLVFGFTALCEYCWPDTASRTTVTVIR